MNKSLQLYPLLPEFIRLADVEQTATSVQTTLGTPAVGGALQMVTPGSMDNIRPGMRLTIDPNVSNQEVVVVQSVAGVTFSAFFEFAHPGTAVVTATTTPPLQALLDAAQFQADLVYDDIGHLWKNFFVETCDDWVLPYIADLIALNLIDDDPGDNRREVARTIAYRRRKGTVPQLETMARDVTGFDARVVEFFQRMIWNQNMIHFRMGDPLPPAVLTTLGTAVAAGLLQSVTPASISGISPGQFLTIDPGLVNEELVIVQAVVVGSFSAFFRFAHSAVAIVRGGPELAARSLATVDVRDTGSLARIGHAFDRTLHTADLRPSTQTQGWYNIRKLGFFLWRLRAIPLHDVLAAAAPAPAPVGAYHFNVLGQPEPLFQSPEPLERGADADWPRTTEFDVVAPIQPYLFRESPQRFWTTSAGFTITVNGAVIGQTVVPSDLCAWTAPAAGQVAADVRLGRFLFNAAESPAAQDDVRVSYFFGFSGYVGGGGYERQATLRPLPAEAPQAFVVHVSKAGAVNTISAALLQLAASVMPLRVVQIDDSSTYSENLTLPANFQTLVIQAADGQRPTLLLSNAAAAFAGPTSGKELVLSGLLVSGAGQALNLPAGIQTFVFEDCTVDPGGGVGQDGVTARPAGVRIQVATPGIGVSLRLVRSIVGPLDLPQQMDCVAFSDSIADAQLFAPPVILQTGPPATVVRSTLLGTFDCYRLEASESLFAELTNALRLQEGCVRFCYFAPNSLVPRRYECAPCSPPPVFTSRSFGDPGYTQLALNCPQAIASGSENGGEIGIWAGLGNPRRLRHLQLRLEEYLPAGLAPLFVFET